MRAKFISADGLSLESTIPYPPLPRIRRPLMDKRVWIASNEPVLIETVFQTRDYEFTGIRSNVAIYEEII